MKVVKPFAARFRLGRAAAVLHIEVPDISRAEIRWATSRLIKRTLGMFHFSRAELQSFDVDDQTTLTVALDLRNRMRKVKLVGNPTLAEELDYYAAAEKGYRTWVNEDPAIRTSIAIASDVQAFANGHESVEATVLEEPDLEEKGLRLLLAVGGASKVSPPRLVMAQYRPPGAEGAPLMLLGKGITFDTGGINVKPYASYVSHMKNDMAGAALAWWLFRSLVEDGYPGPLLVVLPTCENAVGEDAMRPGALVKSYRGHTVRIDHTDAEGRLALADGLAYATDVFKPDRVICFATLTTAALVAYGPYATPVHFADAALQQQLEEASEWSGEDLHFFPYRLWHFEANRDQEGDLKNTARLPGFATSAAGSRNAGHFLKHFTNTPLVHLDIFGSTWNWAGDAPGAGYGATGAPLRTVLRALRQ